MIISPEETERRLRRVSELRALIGELRRNAYKAWLEGKFPYPPAYDIRTDLEYWKKLQDKSD